jgi:hypothetical protein
MGFESGFAVEISLVLRVTTMRYHQVQQAGALIF